MSDLVDYLRDKLQHGRLPARRWFRDKDGTYYRNANCVAAEMKTMRRRTLGDFRRLKEKHDEWKRSSGGATSESSRSSQATSR